MIPKGLKVGATFEDHGKYYKVVKIVDGGYESKRCEAPAPAKKKEPTKAEK